MDHEFEKLFRLRNHSFRCWPSQSLQLSTADCSLISQGRRTIRYSGKFHAFSWIGEMWERRREGNDVQISDFMHSREMGAVGERGNDVQVGAALIPFLVNTSLLILADRRSNHKWEKQLRETPLHLQNPITDNRCLTKGGLIKIEARLKPNFVLLTTVRPPSNPIPSD